MDANAVAAQELEAELERCFGDWRPRETLRPGDAKELSAILAELDGNREGAVIRGSGSQLSVGNPVDGAAVLLDMSALCAIDEFIAEEGVVHALAGTPVESIRDAAAAEGWELPLDPHAASSTLGGTLAMGHAGVRRLGYGLPRDAVLGMDMTLASGLRTSCGGRVVKNVTGYDLAKLYCGSMGTLGVVEGAWLRLRPLPEQILHLSTVISHPHGEDALELGLDTARLHTPRAVAVLDARAARRLRETGADVPEPGAREWLLVAELAGPEAAVRRDVATLNEHLGTEPVPAEIMQALQVQQAVHVPIQSVRARLTTRPAMLGLVCEQLVESMFSIIAHPGTGVGFYEYDGESDPPVVVPEKMRRLEDAARSVAAPFVFDAIPLHAKSIRDVWSDPGPAISIMQDLKHRFDPNRILNPGRYAGGI